MGETVLRQLINELQRQAKDLNQLQYGEVILKVQDGRVTWGEIKSTWKADSNKREARV